MIYEFDFRKKFMASLGTVRASLNFNSSSFLEPPLWSCFKEFE